MSTYDALRHFADSWGLAAMVAMWAAFILWACRPGARERSRAAAESIFEDRKNG